ncbi:hypothetical protein MAC_00269 [Metarhizium acridum CQMa 102]|uniref:Peptidase S8/S53 domain-containing protein n=1 Tax=Metarhizium acridum (strain CQMa 102) TaxID=655827 RepID=E9DRA0_METAQ|nr:uncharacterized protein MAC_00269 [Metarhizium acridum CQMa 102]EFY93778.1 hypothetical protein MAC_00269 [Metarhizium acridum CQMa 102]
MVIEAGEQERCVIRRNEVTGSNRPRKDHRAWFHRHAIFLGQWGMAREPENRTSPCKIALLGARMDRARIMFQDSYHTHGRKFTSEDGNGNCVANAISQPMRKNIICLAATGNNGANDGASFPARMHGVIPTFSTDSYGNPSPDHASPIRGRKNFSTLGENVRVWGDGRTEELAYKSGTSFAVCVAAGIRAAMLVFARD